MKITVKNENNEKLQKIAMVRNIRGPVIYKYIQKFSS